MLFKRAFFQKAAAIKSKKYYFCGQNEERLSHTIPDRALKGAKYYNIK